MVDPNKLTLLTPGINRKTGEYLNFGVPATVVANYLREQRIVPEKCDLNSILFLMTPAEDESKLNALEASKRAPESAVVSKEEGKKKKEEPAKPAAPSAASTRFVAWTRGGPSDTVSRGFADLRKADSTTSESAPRLKPELAQPLPAPVRTRSGSVTSSSATRPRAPTPTSSTATWS